MEIEVRSIDAETKVFVNTVEVFTTNNRYAAEGFAEGYQRGLIAGKAGMEVLPESANDASPQAAG